MLGKLLKHEFKQSARTLLPIFGGATVMLLLAKLFLVLNNKYKRLTVIGAGVSAKENPVLAVLSSVAIMLFVALLLALLFGTMFVTVQRFYRMLGDEGYVLFALPVTPAQHIWAKTLCGLTWTLGAVAYLFVSVPFLMFTGMEVSPIGLIVNGRLLSEEGIQEWLCMLLLLVCMIAGIWATQSLFYLSCAVGSQFGQHRMAASVVAFFVIQTVLQILGMIVFVAFVFTADNSELSQMFVVLQQTDPLQMVNIMLAVSFGVLVVAIAGFNVVLHRILAKKLNLA